MTPAFFARETNASPREIMVVAIRKNGLRAREQVTLQQLFKFIKKCRNVCVYI